MAKFKPHRQASHLLRIIAWSSMALYAVGSPTALATGFASAGSISNIISEQGGVLFFIQHGTRTDRPACATLDRWVINVNTPSGQTMAAALMMAYSMHKQVEIHGTGSCPDWGDTETVDYFQIAN
ncbi:hypothetical protein [Nitrospirillum sp. BR 11163]|uniref:hypothetical protein n=1 Tax=Nitrospirillum sp. BR 11163 TaxID=3104323 RepID=UPI002AFF6655|nr:hypothetical protein [Nitrospirillum sp. BR 11163]MEA1677354.1 hypothetical protein [Nitrospirillum sp. BR 11163]